MNGPRSHGFQVRRRSSRDSQGRPTGIGLDRGAAQVRGHPQRLADREQPDRDDHHVDPVGQLRDAEGEPRLAGQRVQADQPDGQPDGQRGEPAHPGAAQHRGHRDEGQHHHREVVRGADVHGHRGDQRGQQHQPDRPEQATDEVPDRRRGQRLRAAAGAGHRVALHGRHHGRALPGRVEQDRGGGAAEHGPEVDAGEEDEGAGRVERVGHRAAAAPPPSPARSRAARRWPCRAARRSPRTAGFPGSARWRSHRPAPRGMPRRPSEDHHQRSAGQVHAEQRVEQDPGQQRNAGRDQRVGHRPAGAQRVAPRPRTAPSRPAASPRSGSAPRSRSAPRPACRPCACRPARSGRCPRHPRPRRDRRAARPRPAARPAPAAARRARTAPRAARAGRTGCPPCVPSRLSTSTSSPATASSAQTPSSECSLSQARSTTLIRPAPTRAAPRPPARSRWPRRRRTRRRGRNASSQPLRCQRVAPLRGVVQRGERADQLGPAGVIQVGRGDDAPPVGELHVHPGLAQRGGVHSGGPLAAGHREHPQLPRGDLVRVLAQPGHPERHLGRRAPRPTARRRRRRPRS